MMVNIYDTANDLAKQMRETQEYTALEAAFNEMMADKDAFDLFKNFQKAQAAAQQKQMQGQKLTEDEIKNVQNLASEVSKKDVVKKLMEKERQMDAMMQQLNQTITAPIQELYKKAMD
ncbi:MAG TPA: YlbF family regulator [Limosilactobacillus coleohominis]|nr:YlbF family regulator [Limosilactobacillus coleohominis]